jgi:hypothetical protein
MTTIKIKHSSSNSKPSSLNFGELSIGSNGSDNLLSIGNNSSIIPINALSFYLVSSNYTIPTWNSFADLSNTGDTYIITLPKCSSFNKGQQIIIQNISGSIGTINCSTGDAFKFISTTPTSLQLLNLNSTQFISDGTNLIYQIY